MLAALRPKTSIKQFGLQRSGSNYLKFILERNYHVNLLTNEGGWKHGHYAVPSILGREVHCVFTHKDPFSWLTSCHRYLEWHDLHETPESFDAFLRSRLVMNGRVIHGRTRYRVSLRAGDPVAYWNDLHWHWLHLELKRHLCRPVAYVDLLRDPEATAKALAEDLGMRRTTSTFVDADREMQPAPSKMTAANAMKDKAFERRAYYLERKYMEEFTDDQIALVADRLDPDVMAGLGYEIP